MTPSPAGVHFTIGATPVGGATLEKDLNMVKAALLYADRVKLCSFNSSIILFALEVANYSPERQIEFLELLIPYIYADRPETPAIMEYITLYKSLRSKKRLTKDELIQRMKIESHLRTQWEPTRESVMEMASDAGIDGLQAALKSGMVDLHTFNVSSTEELAFQYFDTIKDSVLSGNTYPLLDDQSNNLVKLGIQEGKMKISESGTFNVRHGALVSAMMHRLPSFESATVSEVLNIIPSTCSPAAYYGE